jgi:hypothetical protein
MKQFQLLWPRIKVGSIIVVYAGLVVAFALWGISADLGNVHFCAARYLDGNTRIGERLLIAPATGSLDDSFRLAREKREVVDKYLREPVEMGKEIATDNLMIWPDLDGKETVAVEMDSEPDWMVMNEGTVVEIRAGDKVVCEHAVVLAILPSGAKWLVLLPKSDITSNDFFASKVPATLSVEALPQPAQHTAASKPPCIAQPASTK